MVLTLNEKIGQLFFIGLLGTEINAETRQFLKDISPAEFVFLQGTFEMLNKPGSYLRKYMRFYRLNRCLVLIRKVDWSTVCAVS